METKKIFFRPSAQSMLERAPVSLATLLARYLRLIEGFAQKQGVEARTEVSGYRDPEDGSRQLMILHRVALDELQARGYRSHLGTVIQEWVGGLSREELDLMQEWFVLDVEAEPIS